MATINNVNNGDTGKVSRDKLNANDNALNAELAQKLSSIAQVVTGIEALTGNDRLNAQSLKNFLAAIQSAIGNGNGIQVVEVSPGVFEYRLGGNLEAATQIVTGTNEFNIANIFPFVNDVRRNRIRFSPSQTSLEARSADNSGIFSILSDLSYRLFKLDSSLNQENALTLDNQGFKIAGRLYQFPYTPPQENDYTPKQYVDALTGLLANLNTTDKTNLVAAINEVLNNSGGVDRFENLLDTFDFVGEALKFVRVDAAENALEAVLLGTAAFKNTGQSGDAVPLLNQLQVWSNFNQFDRQVQINEFLTFGITDVQTGGTLADNYAVDNTVVSLTIASASDLTVNSILAALETGNNNNSNRILIFRNESANGHNININNEGTGLVGNRFYLPSNLVIPPRQSAVFIYRDETAGQDGWYLLANSASGGTSYTDQQAREAQGLLKSTGTAIQFDKPREYGNPTAETGNITFNFTDAIPGTTQVITHNSGTKPTMPASANKLAGDYVLSVANQIYLTPILVSTSPDVWRVDVTVSQNNAW